MDPASALGVASAAVAFIDFAITIVGAVHEQCGDGEKLTRHQFEVVINDLLNWSHDLDKEDVAENDSDIRVQDHFKACIFDSGAKSLHTLKTIIDSPSPGPSELALRMPRNCKEIYRSA